MERRIIECPCGTVLRGESEDEVVEQARTHASSVHDMDLDPDQARAMARPD